jgi:hypothetical protein
MNAIGNPDGFANSPISALRFILLLLRPTARTPHSTRSARLELGLFRKPSIRLTFYEFIDFSAKTAASTLF